MVGRKFCHFIPCHESLAINAPNKMRLPIKRTFIDFFALTKKKKRKKKKIKVGHSGCMLKSVMPRMAREVEDGRSLKVVGKRSFDTRIICLSYSTLTASSLSHVRFLHTPSLM